MGEYRLQILDCRLMGVGSVYFSFNPDRVGGSELGLLFKISNLRLAFNVINLPFICHCFASLLCSCLTMADPRACPNWQSNLVFDTHVCCHSSFVKMTKPTKESHII